MDFELVLSITKIMNAAITHNEEEERAGEVPVPPPVVDIVGELQTADLQRLRVHADNLVAFFRSREQSESMLFVIWVLFALKFIVDNFISFTLTAAMFVALTSAQTNLKLQVSLKSQASLTALWGVLLLCIADIAATLVFLHSMGYTESLIDRLLLVQVPPTWSSSFLTIMWNCLITDMFVRLLCCALKCLLCLLMTYFLRYCHHLEWIYNEARKRLFSLPSTTFTHHHNSPQDLESGGLQFLSSPLSRMTVSGSQLARRHNDNTTQQNTEASDTNNVNIVDDDSTTTDGPERSSSGQEYMLKSRICNTVDLISYIYRNLLPIPLWTAYLQGNGIPIESSTGRIFASMYLLIKVADVGWKTGGLLKGIEYLLFHKLVISPHYF